MLLEVKGVACREAGVSFLGLGASNTETLTLQISPLQMIEDSMSSRSSCVMNRSPRCVEEIHGERLSCLPSAGWDDPCLAPVLDQQTQHFQMTGFLVKSVEGNS
jgi:hypothetical protein